MQNELYHICQLLFDWWNFHLIYHYKDLGEYIFTGVKEEAMTHFPTLSSFEYYNCDLNKKTADIGIRFILDGLDAISEPE